MNHIHPIIISMVLIGLVIAPVSAQIPFEITGYVHFTDGSACLDPTVTITNLDTGDALPVMTVPSSSYYMVKPAPLQNEISEGDVLEFRASASAGTESMVMEHRILASDLNSGALFLNITLGTVSTTTGSGAGDPPLPQAPTISTPDTTATITPASTSTAASPPTTSQEKQTPGFEILPASAAIIACLLLGRRLL